METLSYEAMLQALAKSGATLRSLMPGGMADQMGLQAVDCDPAACTALFLSAVPQPWMRNPMGWLHGGMVASLLDSSMGIHCALYSGGKPTPTISLQISYLRPTPTDVPLHIRSRVIKAGRSVIFAESSLWAKDETQPCATASAVYHVPG